MPLLTAAGTFGWRRRC